MRANDPIDTIAVGESQGRKTEAMSLFDQLIRVARPFEEGKIALAPERNVGRHVNKRSDLLSLTSNAKFGREVQKVCRRDIEGRIWRSIDRVIWSMLQGAYDPRRLKTNLLGCLQVAFVRPPSSPVREPSRGGGRPSHRPPCPACSDQKAPRTARS